MRHIFPLAALAFLPGCTSSAPADNQETAPVVKAAALAAMTGSDAALRYFLSTHQSQNWRPSGGPMSPRGEGKQILHATWFPFDHIGAGAAMQLVVSEQGFAHNIRSVYNWAEQASSGWQISPAEIAVLRSELQSLQPLPEGFKKNEVGNVLILSCERGGHWPTQFYDIANLPPTVARLLRGDPSLVRDSIR
jgi:hypothetical protein